MSPTRVSLVADRAAQRERGGERVCHAVGGDWRLGERAADTSAGARKAPGAAGNRGGRRACGASETRPAAAKSPNSWSPFAAVRVREPASVKVLALVGVRTPSICTVVCPRWLTVPVPSVTKARVGANCYMLRCSFLHQGTTQHPQGSFTRIIFTEPKPQRNVFHMNVMDGALNISIREFCKDMAAAALAWQEAAEGTTTYQQTYSSDGKKFTPAYQALAGTLIERAKASRRADGKRRHRWRSKVGCPAPA
jgi:hypothetical protein